MKDQNKITNLFAKDRGMPKSANYPAKFEKTAFEKGKKLKNLFKGLTVSGVASKLPKAATKLGKVGSVARVARMATPIGLGASALKVAYDVATLSPEKKAKVKKLKKELSKKSTKDYHSDLLKMSAGGDTMKKKIPEGPEGEGLRKLKAERPDVTRKMGFAKKGKMLKANKGKDVDIIENISKESLFGKGRLQNSKVSKNNKTGKISVIKKNLGGEAKGYGAARTSGMGLQDEQLVPGKSLDYYKDIM